MEYNLIDLNEILNNADILYAHIKYKDNCCEREKLEEHSNLAISYLNKLNESKGVLDRVKYIIDCLCKEWVKINNTESKSFIFDLFVNGVYLHDVGKSNPGFQYSVMNNERFIEYKSIDKNHSLLSAAIYSDVFFKRAEELGIKNIKTIINSFAYVISRHHTYLEDVLLRELGDKIEGELYNKILLNYKGFNDKINSDLIKTFHNCSFKSQYLYILTKLFYSVLVTCDFAATYEFMNGKEADICDRVDMSDLIERYNNRELIKNIRANKSTGGINKLRTDIFIESENNLNNNSDKFIYYLEAPTGSGKTNTSINIAMNLVKNNGCTNVFYVFPFNTLAEQTSQVMEFWQEGKDFTLINSITPILKRKSCEDELNREDELNYDEIYFNYQLANFPVVITSHVRLFKTLFGTSREDTLWLYKLCNSVIILDEIQSYKNSLWSKMINILYKYSKALNIKIVIMSATLPRLSNFVAGSDNYVCNLIDSKKYFENTIFKDRVKLNYDYIYKFKKPQNNEEWQEYIEKLSNIIADTYRKNTNKSILIEFIKKKSARACYNCLKEILGDEANICELTGDDNKAVRNKIIKDIKNRKINIVVATQVIEAGVDIDMDIGFKDISNIDSEEQFIGRINRSCKRSGIVYFFDCDDETTMYRGDVRNGLNIKNEKCRKYLEDKNFKSYYSKVFDKLRENADSYDHNVNDKHFEGYVIKLQYDKVKNDMTLIDSINYQIVLNFNCVVDDVQYLGEEVWNFYKNLLENKNNYSYGEFKIRLSEVSSLLDMFTFNVYGDPKKNDVKNYTDSIGNMYYYQNGEDYITEDGKFDRARYEEDM